MPRQARLDAPGTLHHVMIRGIERRKIVDDDEDRKLFVDRMGYLSEETGTQIYAWALMGNHAHILLRSGLGGLPKFMRRFLTGYAINYNGRHRRHGHVFQNRYKSIVCEEDAYFKELVRYIHLNPLRAKLVGELKQLDRYRWCGHSVIMGKVKHEWQDRKYVLGWCGKTEKEGKKKYREFVKDGIGQGRRKDLVGGGLVRSMGGWSKVVSIRKREDQEMGDERILGSGKFVEKLLEEADERMQRELGRSMNIENMKARIEEICREEKVSMKELKMGSRRGRMSAVRRRIVRELLEEYGLPLAQIAREVGVSTSAVSNMVRRGKVLTS